jgi:hypothetical protein
VLFSQVDEEASRVAVEFTPTIPHCSMATLIGLSIRVKLLRSLPSRFKVHLAIALYSFQDFCCHASVAQGKVKCTTLE